MDQLQRVQPVFRLTDDLATQRGPVRLTDNAHPDEPLVIYNDHLDHNSSPLPFFHSPSVIRICSPYWAQAVRSHSPVFLSLPLFHLQAAALP